jgi:hypothetical protein
MAEDDMVTPHIFQMRFAECISLKCRGCAKQRAASHVTSMQTRFAGLAMQP